jgi:hypothetical protein
MGRCRSVQATFGDEPDMLPRLSQRTYDLMRRALDAADRDTADLITTLLAIAFVDGGAATRDDTAKETQELEDA